MGKVEFHIPLRLISLANSRMHWFAMAALKKKQRKATSKAMKGLVIPPCPLVVTITRIGKRMLDGDNLQMACKYVRDEIARYVGVDDGSDIYTWIYRQEINGKGYGVKVVMETREF